MAKIENSIQYKAAIERIEELLAVVTDDTSENNRDYIELDLLSGLVSDYEDAGIIS